MPESGQVQDLVATLLAENNAFDVFHVNLVAASNDTNTTFTNNTITDLGLVNLVWTGGNGTFNGTGDNSTWTGWNNTWTTGNSTFNSSLNFLLFQAGTDRSEGECGQAQANTAASLDFSSNSCLTELKPLCMRETGSGEALFILLCYLMD